MRPPLGYVKSVEDTTSENASLTQPNSFIDDIEDAHITAGDKCRSRAGYVGVLPDRAARQPWERILGSLSSLGSPLTSTIPHLECHRPGGQGQLRGPVS